MGCNGCGQEYAGVGPIRTAMNCESNCKLLLAVPSLMKDGFGMLLLVQYKKNWNAIYRNDQYK